MSLDNELPNIRKMAFSIVESAFRTNKIAYGIINGYNPSEDTLGRDVDLAINQVDIPRSIDLATHSLRKCGWKVKVDSTPWATWIFAFTKNSDEIVGLEIDFLPVLQTGFVRLQSGVSSSAYESGPHLWITDPAGSLIKRILLQFIAKNFQKFEKHPELLQLSPQEKDALYQEPISSLLGPSLAKKISHIDKCNWFPLALEIRKHFRKISLHPKSWSPNSTSFAIRRFFSLNILPRRVVPIISLIGPDGVGKSTVITHLVHDFENSTFLSPQLFHWRPCILPNLADLAKFRFRKNPQNSNPVPPRRKAGRFSFIRAIYYSLDYFIGMKLVVNRASIRLYPVIFDRHAIDMLIDPARFGIQSFPFWLFKLIPKPDLTVGLIASPETIYTRKNELELKEIKSQLDAIHNFHHLGFIDILIDNNADPKITANKIFEATLAKFMR